MTELAHEWVRWVLPKVRVRQWVLSLPHSLRVPLVISISPETAGGRDVGRLDLTRLSSWARRGRPLRITFGPDRRPEFVQAELLYGTSLRITVQSTS